MKRLLFMLVVLLLLTISSASASDTDAQAERMGHVFMIDNNASIEYLYRTPIQIPVKMVYGPDGNIYVADWTGHRVLKIDHDYNVSDLGLWRTTDAFRSDGPRGLDFDSQGNLYICNHGHIFRLDTAGVFEELQGVYGNPIGSIAISLSDELYYTDRGDGNGKILKWTPENGSQGIADHLPEAENLVFGSDGSLYFTQTGYPGVLKMDVTTGEWAIFVENICGPDPFFLAIDHEGDIWIRALPALNQYSPDRTKKAFVINGQSSDNYEWNTSAGIAIDAEGGVWIASYDSMISRLIPTEPDTEDPEFTLDVVHAGLYAVDLAVDSNNTLYAINLNEMRILKIDSEGNTETFSYSDAIGGHAIAVDENNSFYYTTKQDEIRRIDQDGNDTSYANVVTECMTFGGDGFLYAVEIGGNEKKSIVRISEQGNVLSLASRIAGDDLGNQTVNIAPAMNEGLYVFAENSRNLYLLGFSGQGRLIGNYSQLGSGPFCMASNPATGEIYLIPHGTYILYALSSDGSYRELAIRFPGDPWGMIASGDGTSIFVAESGAIYRISLNEQAKQPDTGAC